jgi:hypothetical protein
MPNKDKLKQEGLIKKESLPASHQKVIDELSAEEVETLVRIKKKLDKADADEGLAAESFTQYIIY